MDAIREQLQKPLITGIIGLVVGTLFGLVVLGWWLWPVKWVDAGIQDLNFEAKQEYMRLSIQAFSCTGNVAQAQSDYAALGSNASDVLAAVEQNPGTLPPQAIQNYKVAVGAAVAPPGATLPPGTAIAPTSAAGGTTSLLSSLLPIFCLIALLLAAAVIVVFIMRSRSSQPAVAPAPVMPPAPQAPRQAGWSDFATAGTEPPLAQFMASYKLGDDLFDDSFSIDSPAGEFLGECGVGISETIGVGEPKKVTAFEVWLFDKNDIQTVTKVLMSSHAYNDNAIRQRLAAKGEPVLVEAGTETVLETQTLQLVARVVDMGFGDGALPSDSYFDRFILELAVWAKS